MFLASTAVRILLLHLQKLKKRGAVLGQIIKLNGPFSYLLQIREQILGLKESENPLAVL